MVLLFQTFAGHEDHCERGHSQSSMRAAVESALSADAELDCTEITVTMLGPYAVLEGFVQTARDFLRATLIAEDVVGKGYVQSRMLRR
jgi:osmotically-inducible protein OsmY